MKLQAYIATTGDLFSTFSFSSGGNPIDVGTVSDVVTFDLWNERSNPSGGEALGVQIGIQALTIGGIPSVDLQPIVGGWIQGRVVTGALGDASEQSTDWHTIGGASRLDLDTIAADGGRRIEFRLTVPSFGIDPASYNFYLEIFSDEPSNQGSATLDIANFRGVITRVGDYSFSGLWSGGDVSASDSNDVTVSDVEVIISGVIGASLEATETFDDTASDGATSTGGSYLSLIAVDGSGINVIKGGKGASPRSIDDRPAVPVGVVPLAWIEKRNADAIHSGDVVDARVHHMLELAVDPASLTASLSPGQALVGDRIVRLPVALPVALPESSTVLLCLHPDRSLTLSTDRQGLPLWQVTTDGSGVTGLVDVRRRALSVLSLALDLGSACVVPTGGDWAILGVTVAAGVPGITGETSYDLLTNGVTLYTSAGSIDRRPKLPAGASRSGSLPEVRLLRAMDVITLVVAATAGTAPTGVVAQLEIVSI